MLTSSREKFPILDGLRAISILLVLGCHLLPLGPKAVRLNETAGAMGMSLFFALSGYLITSGLMTNQNIQEFLARRLSRILPLAYAYSLVVFLLLSFDPGSLLWTDLFVVNYQTQYINEWNGHFWSLCVEMQFYFAIALVVLIGGRRGLWIVWPACFAITLLRLNAGAYIEIKTHLRVDEILAGACIATIYSERTRTGAPLALLVLAALLWAASASPLLGAVQYFRPYATALLLAVGLHYGSSRPETLLASAPLKYIATTSYALYVIHPATAAGWMNTGDVFSKYLLKRPVSFALTFLLAHLSTFHWENRWQDAAREWIRRRRGIKSAQVTIAPPVRP